MTQLEYYNLQYGDRVMAEGGFEGVIEGFDWDGYLFVKTKKGNKCRVHYADISKYRPKPEILDLI